MFQILKKEFAFESFLEQQLLQNLLYKSKDL